jgi:hypothetical protein
MTTGRINQVTRQTDTRENTGDGPAKGRPPETRRISVCTILAQTDTRANTGSALRRVDRPRPGASRFGRFGGAPKRTPKRLSETRFARQPTNFNRPLTSHLRLRESSSRVAETKWTQQTRRDGSNLRTSVKRRVTVHAGVAPRPGTECNNSLRGLKSEPNTKSPQKVGYPSFAKQLTDQQTTLFSSHRPADTNLIQLLLVRTVVKLFT